MRDRCTHAPAPTETGLSAAFTCKDAHGQEVRISLFDTRSGTDQAYGDAVRDAGVERSSGDCANPSGTEHRYPRIGVPSYPTPDERALLSVVEQSSCHRAPAGALDRFAGLVAAVECDPQASTVNRLSTIASPIWTVCDVATTVTSMTPNPQGIM